MRKALCGGRRAPPPARPTPGEREQPARVAAEARRAAGPSAQGPSPLAVCVISWSMPSTLANERMPKHSPTSSAWSMKTLPMRDAEDQREREERQRVAC